MFLPLIVTAAAFAAALPPAQPVPIETASDIKTVRVKVESSTFLGREALKVVDAASAGEITEGRLAIVRHLPLQDGTIEVDMAGEPAAGAGEFARGFVGVAFRVKNGGDQFECFYLRPTNGRAEDQVRRNHSAQYISVPDFPWQRLRKEFPEKYESYVDLEPAKWTKVRIEVQGAKARLYVHGATQPTLIVDDLKHTPAPGSIGLWVGPGTIAHFANLRVTKK